MTAPPPADDERVDDRARSGRRHCRRPRPFHPLRRRARAGRAGSPGRRGRRPAVCRDRPRQPGRVTGAATRPGADPLPHGLELVPGVEINAVTRGLDLPIPGGELHVIGLDVDPDDGAFEAVLAAQRDARRTRFLATLQRLRDAGIGVDAQLEGLDQSRDDALGRPTVARALIAAGHATSVEDAFRRILGYGMPGYVARQGLGPVDAIRAIRAAGGLASLAHFPEAPAQLSLLRSLVDAGLNGLETHHSSFRARHARRRVRGHLGTGPCGHGRNGLPRRLRPVRGPATRRSCSRTRLPTGSGPHSVADARRRRYHGRPHDHPSAARPRDRPARHGSRRPARPARHPPTNASRSTGPRSAPCRRSSSGRSVAR